MIRTERSAALLVAAVITLVVIYIVIVVTVVNNVNRWDDECQAKYGPNALHSSPSACEINHHEVRTR